MGSFKSPDRTSRDQTKSLTSLSTDGVAKEGRSKFNPRLGRGLNPGPPGWQSEISSTALTSRLTLENSKNEFLLIVISGNREYRAYSYPCKIKMSTRNLNNIKERKRKRNTNSVYDDISRKSITFSTIFSLQLSNVHITVCSLYAWR